MMMDVDYVVHPFNDRPRIMNMLLRCDPSEMDFYRELSSKNPHFGTMVVNVFGTPMPAFLFALKHCSKQAVEYATLMGWGDSKMLERWIGDIPDLSNVEALDKMSAVMLYNSVWFKTFPENSDVKRMVDGMHVLLAGASVASKNGCSFVETVMNYMPEDFALRPIMTAGRFVPNRTLYCWHCIHTVFRMPSPKKNIGYELFDLIAMNPPSPQKPLLVEQRAKLCKYALWSMSKVGTLPASIRTVAQAVLIDGDMELAMWLSAYKSVRPSMRDLLACLFMWYENETMGCIRLSRVVQNLRGTGWRLKYNDMSEISWEFERMIVRSTPDVMLPCENHTQSELSELFRDRPWMMIDRIMPAHMLESFICDDGSTPMGCWLNSGGHMVNDANARKVLNRRMMRYHLFCDMAVVKILNVKRGVAGYRVLYSHLKRVWGSYIDKAFENVTGSSDPYIKNRIIEILFSVV